MRTLHSARSDRFWDDGARLQSMKVPPELGRSQSGQMGETSEINERDGCRRAYHPGEEG